MLRTLQLVVLPVAPLLAVARLALRQVAPWTLTVQLNVVIVLHRR